MELLTYPFLRAFERFASSLETSCVICSPYIGVRPITRLIEAAEQKGVETSLEVKVVTDMSARNLLNGSTDLGALVLLSERMRNVVIVHVPRIHAKVYVSGESLAIVGSANLTDGGLLGNLEYGVCLTDRWAVRRVRNDIEEYAGLGGTVPFPHLQELRDRAMQLQLAALRQQQTTEAAVRSLCAELQRRVEDDLIAVRISGRSINAIFSDTIMYLLRDRGLSTRELHSFVREMHPDLCDDATDRVIGGRHFGKLWKHRVRTAQQHLKSAGLIAYDRRRGVWMRTSQ